MVTPQHDVVVVGGGIAGFKAAEAAASELGPGRVLIISDEDRAPYKRTRISKTLASGFGPDEHALVDFQWYRERGIALSIGCRVVGLDPARRELVVVDAHGNESAERYGALVLATGSEPVTPAQVPIGHERVHVVRTAGDVERLRAASDGLHRFGIVGNGVLGLEISDQLIAMGKSVVLFGASEALSNRVDGATSAFIGDLLSAAGVLHHPGERVGRVEVSATGVTLQSPGLKETVDAVIFCAGTQPRASLARSAGIRVEKGIVVDEGMRTSAPAIFAAGDAAEHARGRISYLWHDAEYQGELAGRAAAGIDARDEALLFRMKCEVFGHYLFTMNHPRSEQEFQVVRDADDAVRRTLYFDRATRLRAAVMIDDAERAKAYVKAVRDGWSLEELLAAIPLPAKRTSDRLQAPRGA